MRRITFYPDADAEVTEAAQYYEARSPGLGSELLGEVERALRQISTNPEACQIVYRRVRRRLLWRFPYNILYAVYHDHIRIVAKRRPLYWRGRPRDPREQEDPGKP